MFILRKKMTLVNTVTHLDKRYKLWYILMVLFITDDRFGLWPDRKVRTLLNFIEVVEVGNTHPLHCEMYVRDSAAETILVPSLVSDRTKGEKCIEVFDLESKVTILYPVVTQVSGKPFLEKEQRFPFTGFEKLARYRCLVTNIAEK